MRNIRILQEITDKLQDAEKRGFISMLEFCSKPQIEPDLKLISFIIPSDVAKYKLTELTDFIISKLKQGYWHPAFKIDGDALAGTCRVYITTLAPIQEVLEKLENRGIPIDSEVGVRFLNEAIETCKHV